MINKANILIIEDKNQMPGLCKCALADAGYTTTYNTHSPVPLDLDLSALDVVLMDFEHAGPERLSFLKEIMQRHSALEIIAITDNRNLDNILTASRHGASDFISKPLDPAAITSAVRQALERSAWKIRTLRSEPGPADGFPYWLEYGSERRITIGMERRFLAAIDRPIYVQLPLEGQYILRNGILLRVLALNGRIHDIYSPVTGCVIRVNEALFRDLDEIRDGGWAVRMQWETQPLNNQERMVHDGP